MPPQSYWERVRADGLAVPDDRPLNDLTAELTVLLGDPDPTLRERLAHPTLTTWISRGVYDDLLLGLGDGMAAGLRTGLGEDGTDTVFRRSWSARVLAACLERDLEQQLVPDQKVLEWGDRLAGWLVRERDLRAFVPGKGWAHAVAHGADALAVLARSPYLRDTELTVLLDVIADRLLQTVEVLFTHDEADRLAGATLTILRRNLVPLNVLEPWVARITADAVLPAQHGQPPRPLARNAQAFLRSLYLHLLLPPPHPKVRSDLLLTLARSLQQTNRTWSHPGQ